MIRIESPGKMFLAGEYSVLIPGNIAIVSAVNRYVVIKIVEKKRGITITLEDFEGINDVQAEFNEDFKLVITEGELSTKQKEKFKITEMAIRCSLAYLSLEKKERVKTNFSLVSHSRDLYQTIGGKKKSLGLGSSAASTVGITSAILALNGYDLSLMETKKTIFKLSAIAHYYAKGRKGSCGDIAASAFGGIIEYSRFNPDWLEKELGKKTEPDWSKIQAVTNDDWNQQKLHIEQVKSPNKISFLVGWTGEKKATRSMVKVFKEWLERNPESAQESCQRISKVAKDLKKAIVRGKREEIIKAITRNRTEILRIQEAIQNDEGKEQFKIETEKLRKICEIAEEVESIGKFSGAGGGDCGYVFIFQSKTKMKSKKRIREIITRKWEEEGIKPLDISFDYHGVKNTVGIKDFDIHFLYTIPLRERVVLTEGKIKEAKKREEVELEELEKLDNELEIIEEKAKKGIQPFLGGSLKIKPVVKRYYVQGEIKQALKKYTLNGIIKGVKIDYEIKIFRASFSKVAIIEIKMSPQTKERGKLEINFDSFIADFSRAEKNRELFFVDNQLNKKILPEKFLKKEKQKSYFKATLVNIAEIIWKKFSEEEKKKQQDEEEKKEEEREEEKTQKEFKLNQRAYPLIFVKETTCQELKAEEFVVKYSKRILGLLTRPSYGWRNLSKHRFITDEIGKNYFYSDLLYQTFHLRAALSFITKHEPPFTKEKCKGYYTDFKEVMIISRMLWFDSHVNFIESLPDYLEEKGHKQERKKNLIKIKRDFDGLYQFFFVANSFYIDKNSRVYLDIFNDAIEKFAIKKRILEIDQKIVELLVQNEEEEKKARLDRITILATTAGIAIALIELPTLINFIHQKIEVIWVTAIITVITVFLCIGLGVLFGGFIIKYINKKAI